MINRRRMTALQRAQAERRRVGIPIVTKWANPCIWCGLSINIGEACKWQPGRGISHFGCYELALFGIRDGLWKWRVEWVNMLGEPAVELID